MKSTIDNAAYIEQVSEQEMGYKASASIDLDAVPSDGNYLDLNGTKFTFRDDPDVDNDVAIGDDATECVTNLMAEALPTEAVYTQAGTVMTIEYGTIGTDGNDYTIDCDYVGDLPDTLSGGSDTPDADWAKVGETTLSYTPKVIVPVSDDDSTSTALKTWTPVVEGDEVILVNSDDTFDEVVLGSIDSDDIDIINSTDPFDDGSLRDKFQLNGNTDNLTDGMTGTKFADEGTADYDTCKFDNGIVLSGGTQDSDNYKGISFDDVDTTYTELTISVWVKLNANNIRCYLSTSNGYPFSLANTTETCFDIYDGDNVLYSGDNIIPDDDAFHHLVFTWGKDINSGTPQIYVDNTEETLTDCDARTTDWTFSFDKFYNEVGDLAFDQLEIYNRVLTSDEVEALYNQQAIKYTATIDQAEAPVAAYFNNGVDVSVCLESNADRVINNENKYLSIEADTADDGTDLVTYTKLVTGQKITVDGVKAVLGEVTDDGGDPALYTAKLDNHGLTTTPKRAYIPGGEVLVKESSATTEFVGTNLLSFIADVGDMVELDGVEVEVTDGTITKEEYVTNGIFSSADNTDNWDASTGATLEITDGTMKVSQTDSDDNVYASQELSLTNGLEYNIVCGTNGGSGVPNVAIVETNGDLTTAVLQHNSAGELVTTFTATADTMYIMLQNNTDADNTESYFTDVTINNGKYSLTFDEQSVAPTTCVVPARDTQLPVVSKTYSAGVFNTTYGELEATGRAISRKIVAEKADTVVLPPMQSPMWKEPS